MLSVTRLVDLARPERRRTASPLLDFAFGLAPSGSAPRSRRVRRPARRFGFRRPLASPLERHRDSHPSSASFSTSPSSGLGLAHRTTSGKQRGVELALEGERDAAGHHHMAVAQPFDGERAAIDDHLGLALHQAAPARRHQRRAGARAAGERQAGAALPDAQPEPVLAQRARPRRYWRVRGRSDRAPASGRARPAGSPRRRRRRRWRADCPCWCPRDPAAAPARPACDWCRRPRAPGCRASRAAPAPCRRRSPAGRWRPMPVFCDSSRPAIVCTVTWSVLRSSISTEATQRVALPQAPASPPSGL